MTTRVDTTFDFNNQRGITGLADAVNSSEPVTLGQMLAQVEGISWKDSVRVASTANVTIASPGTAIDGITLSNGDRVLLKNQTTTTENGIYIFNGSATPMTRALDANTYAELEAARVRVEEGTSNFQTEWVQTGVNGTLGSTAVTWTSGGTSAPAASETTAGIAEIATQAETDAGTDDARMVTPLKLATYAGRAKRFSQDIGDAAATSIVVTHNLGTLDVQVYVRENGGSKRQVLCEVQHTSTNSVTLVFTSAPALNAYRVTVQA